MAPVERWNTDKPHRCPRCYAVAIDLERPRWWRIYTCCRCRTRFGRFPRLAWLLREVGVRCSEHQGNSCCEAQQALQRVITLARRLEAEQPVAADNIASAILNLDRQQYRPGEPMALLNQQERDHG